MANIQPGTLVTRTSILTGVTHTREIPVSEDRIVAWDTSGKLNRPLIQDAFPDLSPDDREFLMTGITPEEWDSLDEDEKSLF
jgi:hypothetical protein